MSDQYDGASRQLVPGTLRGYRAWYLPLMGLDLVFGQFPKATLKSISMHFYWSPGPPARAECFGTGLLGELSYSEHPVPVEGCSCGYYATYRLHDLPIFQAWPSISDGYVIGSVGAYGKIALGARGFRAEYMTIESLILHPGRGWMAEVYQATPVRSFSELTSRFPPSNVDELLENASSEELL